MRKRERARERRLSQRRFSLSHNIRPETQKSVVAVLLLGCAVLFLLASIGKAGPLGALTFRGFSALFGVGYYLIPLASLLVSLLFFFTHEQRFMGTTLLSTLGSIIFGLGLIDLIFPERGGFIGRAVGALELPFGKTAALVVTVTLIIAGILIAGNASLRFKKKEDGKEPKKTEEELDEAEVEKLIAGGEVPEDTSEEQKDDRKTEKIRDKKEEAEPMIIEAASAQVKMASKAPIPKVKDYVPPPLSLLKSASEKPTAGDLRANANIIKRTLESFGIPVDMGEINIGPKVTRYTLKPAEGVKITRITALNQDLALALAAHPIRIEAPIPGKSLVGIEVPNKAAAIVRLGNLMAYQEFANSGPLSFPLGRDVTGEPIFADIERMPHLLVAGATGSGKSIAIHSILTSLLYKNSPATLKLILIDPKRVELSIYEGIPHLVAPVITEAKKTVGVFRWAIEEMERRYEVLLKAGVRDLKSYNKNGRGEPMPYLIAVVDEMADLMASYGREIEGSIVRLAQMSRATGIHLILSTQRPSVEVLTGLIKANITSRIALQVASQVDSRTILDTAGAEKLLGGGDLLFISSEFSKPKRIQCSYLSEEEVRKVTDFIREWNDTATSATSSVDATIEAAAAESNGGAPSFEGYREGDDDDECYDEAVAIVRDAKKASASLLQRRLKIGYARAARLLDIMESRGVVGPGEGAKPREVFIEEENQNGIP